MTLESDASGQPLWQQLIDADRQYIAAQMTLFNARATVLSSDADLVGLVRQALQKPSERGAALRLLLMVDEPTRRLLFPVLVELASVGHSDIQLVRDVMLSLDAVWLGQHIPDEIDRVLQLSATYEEYQRFAELLKLMHSPYLDVLLARAAASVDPDVQDVAKGFGS